MIGPIAWPFVSHRKYAVPSYFSNERTGGCEFFRNDWLAGGSACPLCQDAAILILSRQVFCGCRWGGSAEMWGGELAGAAAVSFLAFVLASHAVLAFLG